MKILSLSDNQLTGSIPSEISNMKNLEKLILSLNQFDGEIQWVDNLNNLTMLNLDNNQFSGKIPDSICDICEKRQGNVNTGYNKFCPPYPECCNNNLGNYQDTSDCN